MNWFSHLQLPSNLPQRIDGNWKIKEHKQHKHGRSDGDKRLHLDVHRVQNSSERDILEIIFFLLSLIHYDDESMNDYGDSLDVEKNACSYPSRDASQPSKITKQKNNGEKGLVGRTTIVPQVRT